MKTGLILSGIIICVFVAMIAFYLQDNSKTKDNKKKHSTEKHAGKKDKSSEKDDAGAGNDCNQGNISAKKTWELPAQLKEVSGITWMNDNQIAAIEDNEGIIYIYDLKASRIAKEIKFAGTGDYEGVQFVKGNFFAIRSDGHLFHVDPNGKVISSVNLPLSTKDNIESLFYDAAHNRLIIAQKDGNPDASIRNVFTYDIATRQFNSKPLFGIDASHQILTCGQKKKKPSFRPSELAIHPTTGDIYVADGPNHRMLVLNSAGTPQYTLQFDKDLFKQVEGLTFTPQGSLYVSTEGVKAPASISLVSFD